MRRPAVYGALVGTAFTLLGAGPSGQDINSFKGGVRIAAGTCATHPSAGTRIQTGLGDLVFSNPTQPVNAIVLCHLEVPEGAVVRRFAMTGRIVVGEVIDVREVFATLSMREPTEPDTAPFFAPLLLNPDTPFEIPGKRQRAVVDLPASGPEILQISRIRAHYIEATVTTKTPVADNQPLRLSYFELYWD